tara:strand:- start:28 stop:264 length:237 start_codon:yes stop_codon:yes gene_type:complete
VRVKKGRTQSYYDKNPRAKRKKKKYDSEYQKGGEVKKYQRELKQIRRDAKKKGKKIEGLDFDHDEMRFIPQSINRAKK